MTAQDTLMISYALCVSCNPKTMWQYGKLCWMKSFIFHRDWYKKHYKLASSNCTVIRFIITVSYCKESWWDGRHRKRNVILTITMWRNKPRFWTTKNWIRMPKYCCIFIKLQQQLKRCYRWWSKCEFITSNDIELKHAIIQC